MYGSATFGGMAFAEQMRLAVPLPPIEPIPDELHKQFETFCYELRDEAPEVWDKWHLVLGAVADELDPPTPAPRKTKAKSKRRSE